MIVFNAIENADPSIVKNNVSPRIYFNEANGFLTVVEEGNVRIAENNETSYAALFVGPDFEVKNREEALSRFPMLPNGPLDADDSGVPSEGDIGAVGSGYVSWPAESPGLGGSIQDPDPGDLDRP